MNVPLYTLYTVISGTETLTNSNYKGDLAELFTVVGNGHACALKDAITNGFDPTRDLFHGGSIISAAIRHSKETLTSIFEIIGTVDIADDVGGTQLLHSVSMGEVREVMLLLSLGASVEWTNMAGDNVFHLAADEHVNDEIAAILSPHATLHALLTQCVGKQTPITLAVENELYGRCALFCERYIELGGSLDVAVGLPRTPMRRIVNQVMKHY